MADLHLGIDYGTSNTVAVLRWPDGRCQPLLFDSSPLLPSAVFATADGRVLVGRDAQRSARTDPARFEPNPKRRIDDLDVLLGDRAYTVTELVAAVLDRVAGEARRIGGGPIGRVTLTHPVAWGPARRKVLLSAVERVGLPEPALLAEPVAAAAYFHAVLGNRVETGQSVVVYDLGAGTFDASVVQHNGSGFETLAYRGLDDIGGLDLDNLIVRHVGDVLADSAPEQWRAFDDPTDADGRRHRLQLWQDAREAREILTRESSAVVYAARRDVIITRAEFEQAASEVLDRTVKTTLAAVREARVRQESIAGWFLVGGASRTPLVATMLLRASGEPATVIEEPQLVVAYGAVHSAPNEQYSDAIPTSGASAGTTATATVGPQDHAQPSQAAAPVPDHAATSDGAGGETPTGGLADAPEPIPPAAPGRVRRWLVPGVVSVAVALALASVPLLIRDNGDGGSPGALPTTSISRSPSPTPSFSPSPTPAPSPPVAAGDWEWRGTLTVRPNQWVEFEGVPPDVVSSDGNHASLRFFPGRGGSLGVTGGYAASLNDPLPTYSGCQSAISKKGKAGGSEVRVPIVVGAGTCIRSVWGHFAHVVVTEVAADHMVILLAVWGYQDGDVSDY